MTLQAPPRAVTTTTRPSPALMPRQLPAHRRQMLRRSTGAGPRQPQPAPVVFVLDVADAERVLAACAQHGLSEQTLTYLRAKIDRVSSSPGI